MNNSGEPGLFTSRDCRRCKAQGMKLWSSTANALQRSKCGDIGSPEGEKMPMIDIDIIKNE